MNTTPVSAKVLDAAIAWKLCLDEGNGSPDERSEFMRWHAASEEHARAWRQLGMLDQRVSAAAGPARHALLQSRAGLRRRVAKLGGGLVGMLLVGVLLAWAGAPSLSPDYWLADQRTGTGELRTLRLEDGTLLSLNTHTAVDIDYAGEQRLIVLHQGEISVETGHQDSRPLLVRTDDGRLRPLGTRFLVKREEQGTRLEVLQASVAARPSNSGDEQVLREGQQVLMTSDGLGQVNPVASGADAWTHGMLVVDNVRLADLVAELGRYRKGHLGVAAEVADLRVTGSFPLTNTDLALASLLPALPVKIERHTPWWVTVVKK
ncbi:FecR family protein [Pseudomonas sp. S 311-6]|uniref:FecR domain-containing protein n=1 Tax=Pseudomonas TaxID=286 RepID=UPI0020978DCA|nr:MULTISPECIES: FecR family protein [Pseudomonas]MCO7564289.1 FecR family protein [Pseudomonas mosselii]MCO7615771.1 FecR family protein [Pseudomonas guariconensis]MCO7638227.1 FecR family protein [Pseudomonas sp. S 311-6]